MTNGQRETMTSRQRVLAALNHEEPDRMPIDLGVHFSTGISGFAYVDLRRRLGLPADRVEMIDMINLLARVDRDVLERFHIDTMVLNPPFPSQKVWNPRGDYRFLIPGNCPAEQDADGRWVVRGKDCELVMPPNGFFFDGGFIDYYEMDQEEQIRCFAKRAEWIYKETDYFTMMMGFSGYFHGLEFACDMLLEPDKCKDINRRILENELKRVALVIETMGDHIGMIEVNSDLGTQESLLCTPDSYLDVVAPYLKQFTDFVHRHSDYKVYMHSCGAISALIPTLIDCGVDVLNPVQISCPGMDPAELKAAYGDRVTFWGGGCDTQKVLADATPAQVRDHVRGVVNTFKPGGGYVFNQVHNIMGNVPADNIIAMLDEAYANSFYTAVNEQKEVGLR